MSESARLKEVRKYLKLSQEKLALGLNSKPSQVKNIEAGNQGLTVELAQKISEVYNINFEWLLTGKGEMIATQKNIEETTYIPVRGEVETSAGAGCYVYDEKITDYICFEKKLLKQLGANIAECDVLRVKGDSMEPTLTTGDKILVDKSKKDVLDSRIYILRVEDTLYVKRLQKLPKGRLRVISDNKDFESFELVPNEDDYEVCGRVLWSGRIFI